MSEVSTAKLPTRHHGNQQQAHPEGADGPSALPNWIKDYGFFIALGALCILVALDQAAKAITWPSLLSAIAAGLIVAAWIWHLIASRRRAAQETHRQLGLYLKSSLDKVDAMGGIAFERYVAGLLRLDGHQDVRVVGGKGDGGVDIVSDSPSGRAMAYQCKRQKDRVPIKVIRELNGSLAHEHCGRSGVLVTSAEITKDAGDLARKSGITVIERTALADWMSRTRSLIEQQGNAPSGQELPARRSSAKGTAAVGLTVALLVAFAMFHSPASTHPAAKTLPGHSARRPMSPAAVIEANFAAINRHDWRTVWQLWYHPAPGYGPGYRRLIDGYRLTARDVVTGLKTRGSAVFAHVVAYDTTWCCSGIRLQIQGARWEDHIGSHGPARNQSPPGRRISPPPPILTEKWVQRVQSSAR